MELEELIGNTLRRKHLEEMMGRPEKEHTPLEGMDNEQIKRFALFLFEENQKKSRQLDEMIARLDEIGKDLKEVKRENASLLKALLEANSNAEKVVLEYKLRDKEYRKLEKKYNALLERLSIMNTQAYASSGSLKGIDRKRVVKGKHDDKAENRMVTLCIIGVPTQALLYVIPFLYGLSLEREAFGVSCVPHDAEESGCGTSPDGAVGVPSKSSLSSCFPFTTLLRSIPLRLPEEA